MRSGQRENPVASVPVGTVIWGSGASIAGPFEAPVLAFRCSRSAGGGDDQARFRLQDIGDTEGVPRSRADWGSTVASMNAVQV